MQSTEILLAIDLLVYKTEYATLVPGVGYLILSIPIGLADLWVIATYTCCYRLLLLYILTAKAHRPSLCVFYMLIFHCCVN